MSLPTPFDLLGQNSARQEEITVVFPSNRKVALKYMEIRFRDTCP